MIRNKYTKEFEFLMKEKSKTSTFNQLLKFAKKCGYDIDKNKLQKYLYKHNIRPTDYHEEKRNGSFKRPIGFEYTKPDGMVLVKVGEPSKWKYKQRYIYEQHYGKIPKDYMVIFLDGDRTNFDIKNLKAIHTREYNFVRNKHLLSNDKDFMETSLLLARTYYEMKDKGMYCEKENKKMGEISSKICI